MFFKKKEVVAKRGDWVVVIHNWFVTSKSFKHFVFNNMTKEEVKKEAKALTIDNQDAFNHCAFYIIKLDEK